RRGGSRRLTPRTGNQPTITMNYLIPDPRRHDSSSGRRPEASLSPMGKSLAEQTLLLVDDDEDILDLEVRALGGLGYRLLAAAQPAEALRLAVITPTIDLLLTDYTMPNINGLELTRRFRAVHPKTPVLMVSGSLEMLNGDAIDLERFATLPKPFTVNQLVHRVRASLNATLHLTL
ncbi:MAG: response regulator, partial [Limisphaerales bacterium]